jgi:hypothetical protein
MDKQYIPKAKQVSVQSRRGGRILETRFSLEKPRDYRPWILSLLLGLHHSFGYLLGAQQAA